MPMLKKYFLNALRQYADLRALKHSAYFDEAWYLATCPEAEASGVPAYQHYYATGWKKGYEPNRFFHSDDYMALNPDLRAVHCCPLAHYIRKGRAEWRPFNRYLDIDLYARAHVLRQNQGLTPPSSLRACVILHMYPPDSFEYVRQYLFNVPSWVDIHILSDTADKLHDFREQCAEISPCAVYVHQVQNVGRDTGALLMGARSIIHQYDCFCFAHMKRSPQCNYGEEWREYLFHHLLGSQWGIEAILREFAEDACLGMVYPPMFPRHLYSDLWDAAGNKRGVERLGKRFGWNLPVSVEDTFPVGGMFWARTRAVAAMFAQSWTYKHFCQDHTDDGALRHHIERVWPLVARQSGCHVREILLPVVEPDAPPRFARNGAVYYLCEHWDDLVVVDLYMLTGVFAQVFILYGDDVDPEEIIRQSPATVVLRRATSGCHVSAWLEAVCGAEIASFDAVVCLHSGTRVLRRPLLNALLRMEREKADFIFSDTRRDADGERGIPRSDMLAFSGRVLASGVLKGLRDLLRVQPEASLPLCERSLAALLRREKFHLLCLTPLHQVRARNFSLPNYPLAYLLCGSPIFLKESMLRLDGRLKDFLRMVEFLF